MIFGEAKIKTKTRIRLPEELFQANGVFRKGTDELYWIVDDQLGSVAISDTPLEDLPQVESRWCIEKTKISNSEIRIPSVFFSTRSDMYGGVSFEFGDKVQFCAKEEMITGDNRTCYIFKEDRLAVKQSTNSNSKYDAFICHASEDKEHFVRPLAEEMSSIGHKVWYDEFEIEIGDSIRRSIDEGLAHAEFGIVILSSHFFEKDWTQYELNGLIARDVDSEKTILPVWYKIDKEEIKSHSPPLADKMAIQADTKNISEVAKQLSDVIRNNS